MKFHILLLSLLYRELYENLMSIFFDSKVRKKFIFKKVSYLCKQRKFLNVKNKLNYFYFTDIKHFDF